MARIDYASGRMTGSQVDVSALLRAAYRTPAQSDELAARVRARVALLETIGEAVRLLVEAPSSALLATISTSSMPEHATDDQVEGA
jgi:hypothetical protein